MKNAKKYAIFPLVSCLALANTGSMSFYGGISKPTQKERLAAIAGINQTSEKTENASPVAGNTAANAIQNGIRNVKREANITGSYNGYDLAEFENRGAVQVNRTSAHHTSSRSSGSSLSREKEYKLVNYIHTQNPKLTKEEIYGILEKVWRHSKNYKMNPYLVLAVMNTESNFKHSTVSKAGAMGLMQLMDFNIREFGVDNSVEGNIKGGVMHLARDYYSHNRSVVKTLVCYNAGCGRLPNDAWKNIKETREYIPKVKKYFDRIVSL